MRWWVVVFYAVAMAWVEATVVFYLRTMINRIEPYQPDPLPIATGLAGAELVRELATMIMLFTTGWLAGSNWRARFGYMLIAFGVWDILYYAFLKVMTGWPNSLLDWDVLFLIPLPWWGPWLAPVLIATLMILFGTLASQYEQLAPTPWPRRWHGLAATVGIALALYVFMADAIQVAGNGEQALRAMLPVSFQWPLFLVALGLMAVPVCAMAGQVRVAHRSRLAEGGGTIPAAGQHIDPRLA